MAKQSEEIVRTVGAVDGVEIEYAVAGAGAPLILMHGTFTGRYAFSRQRGELEARYRVILPSSRGHDGTDLTLPADYGIGTSEVDDLLAVLDAESVDRIHLIGHSSGGATAFAFARRYPERVDRMVLVEPTLLALLPPAKFDVISKDMNQIIHTGESEGDTAALLATMKFLTGDAWAELDEETKASQLESLAPFGALVVPHLRALLDFAVTESDVRLLRPPLLLIYGGASFEFEAGISERFRAIRPDIEQLVIDGAGHNVHRERREIVTSAIVNHLAEKPTT